jgi:hypothetical protein
MIEIIQEVIPNGSAYCFHEDNYYMHSPKGTYKVKTEFYTQKMRVPGNLYSKGVVGCIDDINKAFERELNWLIINKLTEVPSPARVIHEVPVEDFTAKSIILLLIKYFDKRTDSLRVVCSPDTFRVLNRAIIEDESVCGSFLSRNTLMSVPVITEKIPDNEIWLINLTSWRLPMSTPNNSVEFDPRSKQYVYTRSFKMALPICVGDKLIRVKILAEDPKAKEMRELLDRMRLPLHVDTKETPLGRLMPSGESVWLTENPEDGLCVTNILPKNISSNKTIPQMFNPGTIADYQGLGKDKKKKK